MNAITTIETSKVTPSFLDRNLIETFTNDYQKSLVEMINVAGYTVATRGHHAGSSNSYHVFIYKNSDVSSLKRNNNAGRAVCTFSVRYRAKRFFWAKAERIDMSEGLRSFIRNARICI